VPLEIAATHPAKCAEETLATSFTLAAA